MRCLLLLLLSLFFSSKILILITTVTSLLEVQWLSRLGKFRWPDENYVNLKLRSSQSKGENLFEGNVEVDTDFNCKVQFPAIYIYSRLSYYRVSYWIGGTIYGYFLYFTKMRPTMDAWDFHKCKIYCKSNLTTSLWYFMSLIIWNYAML